MSRRRDSYDIGSVIVFVPSSSLCVILIDNKRYINTSQYLKRGLKSKPFYMKEWISDLFWELD